MNNEELERQTALDEFDARKIDLISVYDLVQAVRTLIIIVLVCTLAIGAGLVGVWSYSANTREDTKATRRVACEAGVLFKVPLPKECR